MNIFLSYTEYELHLSEVCIFGCSKQTICKLLNFESKNKSKKENVKKSCVHFYTIQEYIYNMYICKCKQLRIKHIL